MARSYDLLSGLLRYGRGQMQNFVVKSMTISDAVIYLKAELCLEMARVMFFRTADSETFERILPLLHDGPCIQSHESTSQNGSQH